MRGSKFFFFFVICVGCLFAFYIFLVSLSIPLRESAHIFSDITVVPHAQTGIVLGAKVYTDGRLSDITRDRAQTAIDLYEAGKIDKILVSGDHGQEEYDEVNTIKDYLISNGIPDTVIFLDHAGFDTYDSIYRAKSIFLVESAIIVSQDFHLPRALYLADQLDLDAVGFSADMREYRGAARNDLREVVARVKAVLDITLGAKPIYGGEQIPITGDAHASWDK